MGGDVAIAVGLERDALRAEVAELTNRVALLRESLSAIRAGESDDRTALFALGRDEALAVLVPTRERTNLAALTEEEARRV